jgi:hypothetical protein
MAMIQMRPAYDRWFVSRCLNLVLHGSPHGRSRINSRLSLLTMLMIALLLCPLMGRAQELAATLSGIVTDSSGAVIPHATVTITLNGVNGIARAVESDGNGNYVATNLIAGTYSITVTVAGFETYKGKDIVLNVGEKHAVNVQLKAGTATTTVTVEDNPVSIDTESSAQSGTISGTQVRELELANRNFEQLVTLQPGVVNNLGDNLVGGGSTGLAINGARTTANNWTVDGADINDSGSNATITNVPSIDAIQELTLQRGSYDAGYGRSGGGQVVVATRNGTSAFHGGVYEFDRNTALNANDYFNKQTQLTAGEPNTPSVYHYNNYGFTIGGPVFIPKAYNAAKKKTFFFVSEEWFKTSTPGNASFPAATSSEISGVVPGQFTNGPANCLNYDASANTTTIATSCFSKNSQVYLADVYAKNPANSGGNYAFSYSAKQDEHQDIARVDHYFNDKVHFFARGMNDNFPNNQPMGLWAGNNYPGLVNTAVDSPGKNVVGNLTWAISPKIVNEVEFVYAQGTYNSTIQSGQFATSTTAFSALTNNWAYTDPYLRVPSIAIKSGLQGFSPGSAPWKERNLDRTYFDNLSVTLGKHTLRTGFQFQQMIKTENAVAGGPTFSFNTWGDFLLGNVLTYTQASRDITPDLHYINSEAYVQDDWKISRRLTLNLGVRWSRFPSPTDVKNTLNNFDPLLYSAASAPVIDPTTGNFDPTQTALIPATYTNGIIFPQGAACTAAKAIASQVTCSPYGSYINPNNNLNFGPRIGFAYNPDGRGMTAIRGGFGIFYDRILNGIWEQNAFADPPLLQTTTVNNTAFDAPSGANAVSYGPNGLTVAGTPTFKVPHYANFNLSVERQLLPSTTLEVAYVGNVARHLPGEFDMNQPTEAARLANTTADVNALRPYLGYGFMHTRAPLFTNNYNALQVSLQHRSSKGLTLGLAYTWSKDLTTNSNDRGSSASNSYDFKQDYGPSATNTPQIVEVNYIYQLPFYKQQIGLIGHVLGGWQVSGISSFVSGASFTVTQTTDPFAAIGPNGLGMVQDGDDSIRPDQISPIHRSKTAAQWFSTSSFATATGHFGTERVGSLLGPGVQNWDLASIKNLKLGEHVKFQLRGEYFNAFNHTNFSGVDSSINDTKFGQVISAHVPRRIQIGAKLNF